MDENELEAARILIDFARDADNFNTEQKELHHAADVLETYLDGE